MPSLPLSLHASREDIHVTRLPAVMWLIGYLCRFLLCCWVSRKCSPQINIDDDRMPKHCFVSSMIRRLVCSISWFYNSLPPLLFGLITPYLKWLVLLASINSEHWLITTTYSLSHNITLIYSALLYYGSVIHSCREPGYLLLSSRGWRSVYSPMIHPCLFNISETQQQLSYIL